MIKCDDMTYSEPVDLLYQIALYTCPVNYIGTCYHVSAVVVRSHTYIVTRASSCYLKTRYFIVDLYNFLIL